MISKDEIAHIGQFNKPHGVNGELSFTFHNDSFDGSDCPFFICEINGILVPFYVEGYRFRSGSSAFVVLRGIETEKEARQLAGLQVYFPKKHLNTPETSDNESWRSFIGFTVEDLHQGILGTIVDIDDSTLNTLFIVENNQVELLIPATEEWIIGVDAKARLVQLDLPEGLLDL